MSYRITQSGKHSLILETPVMNAAGMLGFGDNYRDLLKYEKLGAFVTNPITYAPRSPANGTRIVPLDAGVLVHTGLPNPGMNKVISGYRAVWEKLGAPIITHIVVTTPDEIRRCLKAVDQEEIVDAVELGLHDETPPAEVERLIRVARDSVEKPIIVVLPFNAAQELAQAVIDGGGDALVACSAPRGTARDNSGKLVAGRVYGPTIKPLNLRYVGQLARRSTIPIIGAGGIHSTQDAKDYLEAGAVAVQVDAAVWSLPKLLENISRELGGMTVTQPIDALDNWDGE